MKNFKLSVVTVLAMSAFAVAGGDIEPVVEPMVVEEVASDSGFYIGGAYSLSNQETNWQNSVDGSFVGSEKFERDSSAYMLQAGYKFNQYIAIEGRYWDSMETDTWSSNQQWGNYSNSDGDWSAWGIYAKPMYPVTEAVDVYALLGYGNVSIEDKWSNNTSLLDENGFQWGIGASFDITDNLSLFADYVVLCSDEGETFVSADGGFDSETVETSMSTVNIGLSYKF